MQAQLVSKDQHDVTLAQGRTTCDRVVRFGPTGNDDTGDGSAANPFATYDRAMADVPENIDHKVIVKGKAGAYTSTRQTDRRYCSRTGQFILECEDAPVHVAGPFTVSAATEINTVGSNSGVDVQVVGAGWAVDVFYRKFIRFLDGFYVGNISAVYSNSEEHIIFPLDGCSAPAPGDTFEIIEPAMSITWERAPTFTWNGSVGRLWSQYAIANISFRVPHMDIFDPVDPYYYGPFVWDGDGNVLMGVVEFFGEKAWTLLEMLGGLINSWYLPYPEQMADPTLIAYWAVGYGYWAPFPSLQLVGRSTPPIAADNTDLVSIAGYKSGGEWQTGLRSFCARQGIYFESPRGAADYFMASSVYSDHHTFASCMNFYLAPIRGAYAIRVDDRSYLDLMDGYIANATGVGILCTDLAEMIINNVRGNAAAITQYGLSAGAGVKIKKEGTTDLAGVLGAIRFTQSATTEAWPTATNVKTDLKGSFVIG